MGLGRTARGCSFVYHAGTAVDGVGRTCWSPGGMVSWPRSWHTLPEVYPRCSGDVVPQGLWYAKAGNMV